MDDKLSQIMQRAGGEAVEADDGFLYIKRDPFSLLRVPLSGGPEETVAYGVLDFAMWHKALYFLRQDANPPSREGLNLYRLNDTVQLICNVGFGVQSLQLSPDGRFIYAERHDPKHREIMQLRIGANW